MNVISFQDVSKKYKLYSKGGLYLRDRVTHALSRLNPFNGVAAHSASGIAQSADPAALSAMPSASSALHPLERDFWALKNVSFEIKQGESVGFIGRNGAGKSTILKLLAGVTKPSAGNVTVTGRVAALIEVGAGFHPELTGRENIFLNGSILGMKKSEIEKQLDSIVAFAELENFIDTPVKHYSSGMYVRLGFAVAAHTNPDIYLIDEVLAVGDEAFQKKCLDTLAAHKAAGKSMILVSHNLEKVAEVCARCIYVEHGEIRYDGHAKGAITAYRNDIGNQAGGNYGGTERQVEFGLEAKILGVIFRDENGSPKDCFNSGDDVIVEIQYEAINPIEDPVIGFSLRYPQNGLVLAACSTKKSSFQLGSVQGRASVFCHLKSIPLSEGTYLVSVALQSSDVKQTYDYHYVQYSLKIGNKDSSAAGVFQLSCGWTHDELFNKRLAG